MKKAYSWGLVFLLAVSMALLPVQAVSNEQKSEVIHTEFGDLEVETTTVIRNTLSRSSSVSVNRTKTIKNSGITSYNWYKEQHHQRQLRIHGKHHNKRNPY